MAGGDAGDVLKSLMGLEQPYGVVIAFHTPLSYAGSLVQAEVGPLAVLGGFERLVLV